MTAALRGAIIGFGNVAEHGHLPAWRAHRDMRIVTVVEPDDRRRARAGDLLPEATLYRDVDSMFRETPVDFVDVATPPALHVPAIKAAAAAGAHVVCEKPLVVSADEYREARRAVEDAGVALFTVHNWKYSEPFRRVRALLDAETVGPLTRIAFETVRNGCATSIGNEWRMRQAVAGGGILVDHGWHAFYLMLALANQRPLAIRAELMRRRYLVADVEDSAHCLIEFPSLVGEIDLTWAGSERRTCWHLAGRYGDIDVTDDRVVVRGREISESFTCAESLSAGSHHPEWFAAVIDAFHREIVDPGARGENLAEAEQCVLLLSLAYASHGDAGRAQPLPKPSAESDRRP